MTRVLQVLALLAVLSSFCLQPAVPQERSQGISLHMLPKRVAEIGGSPWGFSIDKAPKGLDGNQKILETAEDVLNYVRQQKLSVQQNGIWIVTTAPEAYSDQEVAVLERVKAMCRKENIPLFICRASLLPNGWTRFDK